MSEYIQTESRSGVAVLTLNRPEKRNALTRDFINELNRFVMQVSNDSSIRLLVLQGNGKVFCAGMDLGEMQSRAAADDPEREWQHDSEIYNELVTNLFSLPIPTLAVLQGPVLAGGTGMVFACDLILADESAFVSLPEPKRGIVAAMVTPLIAYRTNIATASYLLFSGKPLSATEALSRGLYHEVVRREQLQSAKNELINSILTGSRSALQASKTHLRNISNVDVIEQIRNSTNISAEARRTDDAAEGLSAFNEKRQPNWTVSYE